VSLQVRSARVRRSREVVPPRKSDGRLLVFAGKAEMVTDFLRELVLTGQLAPGEALRQRDLAERFGVSPTPVREAFRRLQSEGLVTADLHRGVTVLEADEGATLENFRIRAVLESLAVTLATPKITDADIDEIDAINGRLMRAKVGDDDYKELNRLLHFRVYECADSPLLMSVLRLVWQSMRMKHGPAVLRSKAESIRQHKELIQALRARDSERAAALTREHILEALEPSQRRRGRGRAS
jgi:DNA-binding GntR family transcriptional regulator